MLLSLRTNLKKSWSRSWREKYGYQVRRVSLIRFLLEAQKSHFLISSSRHLWKTPRFEGVCGSVAPMERALSMRTKYSSSFLKTVVVTSGCFSSASEVTSRSSLKSCSRNWREVIWTNHNYFILLCSIHSYFIEQLCKRSMVDVVGAFEKRHSSAVHVCHFKFTSKLHRSFLHSTTKDGLEELRGSQDARGGTNCFIHRQKGSGIQIKMPVALIPSRRPDVSIFILFAKSTFKPLSVIHLHNVLSIRTRATQFRLSNPFAVVVGEGKAP